MKARLIKNSNDELEILCEDGSVIKADLRMIYNFIFRYLAEKFENGEDGKWKSNCLDMDEYPGETIAYINDNNQLVIIDPTEFDPLLESKSNYELSDFITVKEYAKAVGKSIEQVKVHLRDGRIPNAARIGRDWIIAKDSINKYPQDHRYKKRGKNNEH